MDLLSSGQITRRSPLVVIALLAALLMLIGVTAVSSLDFTNTKRR